jgi:hypothetical protein
MRRVGVGYSGGREKRRREQIGGREQSKVEGRKLVMVW